MPESILMFQMLNIQFCELFRDLFLCFLGCFCLFSSYDAMKIASNPKAKYRNELKLESGHFAANEQFLEGREGAFLTYLHTSSLYQHSCRCL